MKLVIAEKPSVAISIAKIIGATNRKEGYYEGNGYKVSWCIGHLIQMANPNAYDEKYAKWKIDTLPIIPKEYKYEVSKNTKKQFNVLKRLLNDKSINSVVNACDAGREGELIFRLVYEQAGCKKKVERLWISSMEDKAIKDGFANLKDGIKYQDLYESAKARAIADWIVGMNLSRLYSCLYNQNYSVGRVQTPTLNMIVTRDFKIEHFKKEKYHTLDLELEGFCLSSDRIDDRNTCEELKNKIGDEITITDVIRKEKITKPDLLYDLTTLQRECNKYFGFSAKNTLDYAQSLYEKKLITYPRTDSRYLTEDMIEPTINNILGKHDFDTERIKVIFNSSKVTDHHAIIPTASSINHDEKAFKSMLEDLSETEKKVYLLVLNKFYTSVGYPLRESITKVVATFKYDDKIYEFKISGREVIDEGFTKYLKDYQNKKKDEVIIPEVKIGDVLAIKNKIVKEKCTTPPKHFTEDTLLKAMEVAGSEDIDKDAEIERKGLGTPATRAGIIETLIAKGFVVRDKKNLVATKKGVNLVTIVEEDFKSEKTTVKWEMLLSDLAKGKSSKENFLKGIEKKIVSTIDKYKNL